MSQALAQVDPEAAATIPSTAPADPTATTVPADGAEEPTTSSTPNEPVSTTTIPTVEATLAGG